ncbi:MAG: TIGR03790 family protein [Verrucomicrobiota bacterium]|jgi:uncharacterized protein (TIGR03790 family)
MRSFFIVSAFVFSLSGVVLPAAEPGDAVVVVYNSQMPESKQVADHYVARRHVPENQVVGLNLTTNEMMTRSEYRNQLENPLLHFLEAKKLLTFEPETVGTDGGTRKLKEAKIRYAVLCYGVPLKIWEDGTLKEHGEEKLPEVFRRNGAAVDSELCLLPWTNAHRMLAGFTANPVYGATNAALLAPSRGLLMVARLDGPDAAIAGALVDKAMEAESNGLWGRAYFDMLGQTNGALKQGDDWIGFAALASSDYGFETVVDDKPETFSAGFPMSQIALYAGWYARDVCGPFAQSNVEFMPGAFAYHLHSFSAYTLRHATNYWCGPLLADGAAATMGCVEEPYLVGTPNVGIFFARWLAGFTFGEAAYASQAMLSWQTTVIGDPLYRPFGKNPRELHEALLARHSPLIEWSHLRFVNLNLLQGSSPGKLVRYLQDVDVTSRSAVLAEKMGDLYLMEGQTNLAFQSWQQALKLNPTSLQAVRLTLDMGDNLASSGKVDQALDLCDAFLEAHPAYPDALVLYRKLEQMAEQIHKSSQARRYAKEIERLTPPPAK